MTEGVCQPFCRGIFNRKDIEVEIVSDRYGWQQKRENAKQCAQSQQELTAAGRARAQIEDQRASGDAKP